MKLKMRNPWLIQIVALLTSWLVKAWCSTLLHRVRFAVPETSPLIKPEPGKAVIYVLWHESLLYPCHQWARRHSGTLISQHADGDLMAGIARHCGLKPIRGSSSRGGMKAMREMIRASARINLSVACDGPRGPRRQLKAGVIWLAAWSGRPLILTAFGHDRPWRFKSWDRFALPRPFTKTMTIFGEPIHVPADITAEQVETLRRDLEIRLNQLAEEADAIAEGRPIRSPGVERKAAA